MRGQKDSWLKSEMVSVAAGTAYPVVTVTPVNPTTSCADVVFNFF